MVWVKLILQNENLMRCMKKKLFLDILMISGYRNSGRLDAAHNRRGYDFLDKRDCWIC